MVKKIVKLTILETSDVHGAVFPINYKDNSKVEIGFGKLSTLIKKEREESPNVFLIDNGDLIQGNPFTYYYSKINSSGINPMIKVLNYLKYDAAVIGNHEFNYGQELLENAISESKFQWLSGNILKTNSQECFPYTPYIIREYEGMKIGVLGLITKHVPNWENTKNIEGLTFGSPVEYSKKWVRELREVEKVDIVIVSYHGGFETDNENNSKMSSTGENQGYEICNNVDGIDVLLTGHQHRHIADRQINGVLIIQPGNFGDYLGKVTIEAEFDGKWRVLSKKGELLSVKGIEADVEIFKLVDSYEKATQKWLDTPIGNIKGDMVVEDPFKIRLKDNPLIEFMNKVQMEAAGVDISCTPLFNDNCAGLKAEVSMRDIVSNYIYPNTLKVVRVSGADIRAALEKSAAYFELFKDDISGKDAIKPSGIKPYNYDMWGGIDYLIDVSKPIGQRVVKLDYKNSNLDLAKSYDVVINSYRASGGGDFHMFKNKHVVKEIPIDVSELIANYILKRKVVEANTKNSWKVVISTD
jgi:2',3'-cyclic-nucleotide 2'-phosphodiesterase/3'-nucleotidase